MQFGAFIVAVLMKIVKQWTVLIRNVKQWTVLRVVNIHEVIKYGSNWCNTLGPNAKCTGIIGGSNGHVKGFPPTYLDLWM